MAIRHNVSQAVTGEQLTLSIEEGQGFSEWKDGSRMLVDSDQLSFIYVMETEDDLVYIGLPEPLWGQLNEALVNELPVVLKKAEEDTFFELSSLHAELSYLLENIKDNSNYGDDMLKAVDRSFTVNSK
ncbi:hypothetical protein [Fictibacillus terranigra]|uniref:Uncharacterized protein n=1 Tax=Fictibacillus terranigra TaxID=3058424 RepID=A0ABT8E6Y8_9BACL|nr:hypothetical protein [Fictibacillus sp. CENA-BCM004]MDN4073679.1 hypothetical protein [Fictibacillus sp. CENA-BCM004]